MIRVLIVDDEYLTRKGMVLTLPWDKYGMSIVGEAAGVKEAEAFLTENQVDVVFTDIAMPDGSGLELLEIIKKKYQDIHVVIVTCHRDFGLIQNALRLGAIDYIVKTELEEAVLEERFTRIYNRILSERVFKEKIADKIPVSKEYGFMFVAKREQNLEEIVGLECFQREVPVHLEKGILLYIVKEDKVQQVLKSIGKEKLLEEWNIYGLNGIDKVTREELKRFIYSFIINGFFYQSKKNAFKELNVTTDYYVVSATEQDRISHLEKDWSDIRWIIDKDYFERICQSTIQCKPDRVKVEKILLSVMAEWCECFEFEIPSGYDEKLRECVYWEECRKIIEEFGNCIAFQIQTENYSREIISQIFKSIRYIKTNYDSDVGQEEIAKIFNINRSYFSKAFKDIFGISYVSFSRNYKLMKAKWFLENSSYTIYQIAEKVGFTDTRYFGKIFKEYVGILPSEYREKYNNL